MTPSPIRNTQQGRAQALATAKQTLKDLKEVSRWQTGLLNRLQQTIQKLQDLQDSNHPHK